jgi:hypothetical protein
MRYLLVSLLAVAIAVPAVAGSKADQRLLKRLKKVDGAGSGLDADTVRGRTPDDMTAEANALAARVQALESRLDAATPPSTGNVPLNLYARASREVTTHGQEEVVQVFCNDPNDVGISCSGGAFDGSVAFPITWIGVVLGDGTTKADSCMVVVGAGATTPNLEATVRCLAVP